MDALFSQQSEVGTSFRTAMRRLASTVTIVTSADGARHQGMTMTAVSSLSMDPRSMLACVNQSTFLHEIMLSGRRFCVNVLRHDHVAVATAFSGASSREERFQVGHWLQAEDGIDYLSDAQANIFCKKVAAVPFGTHTIFIGTAVDVTLNDDANPLLYRNAAYYQAIDIAIYYDKCCAATRILPLEQTLLSVNASLAIGADFVVRPYLHRREDDLNDAP